MVKILSIHKRICQTSIKEETSFILKYFVTINYRFQLKRRYCKISSKDLSRFIFSQQQCIPVECVQSAAVAVSGDVCLGGVCPGGCLPRGVSV